MSQRFLTTFSTFSIVMIQYSEGGKDRRLENRSFIRSAVTLNTDQLHIENSLFQIQTIERNEFKTVVEFGQGVLLRHRTSNRYLSYSDQCKEEQQDTTYGLQLSERRCLFKFQPCFQYQTKISNKVNFGQDAYLCTEVNGAKMGFVSVNSEGRVALGINFKSKFYLSLYCEFQKNIDCYYYGCTVWLMHVETKSFLSVESKTLLGVKGNPQLRNKPLFETNIAITNSQDGVPCFRAANPSDDLQAISGLWRIEHIKHQKGGKIQFGDNLRLKHLSTGAYLTLSSNNKQVNLNVGLDDERTDYNKWMFLSLKSNQNTLKKKSYLIFKHPQSNNFVGIQQQMTKQSLLSISTSQQLEEQDLFQIKELNYNTQEAVRFVFALKNELIQVQKNIMQPSVKFKYLVEIQQLYKHVSNKLSKFSENAKLLQDVQDQCAIYIPSFITQILQYRRLRSNKTDDRQVQGVNLQKTDLKDKLIYNLQAKVYHILQKVCRGHNVNQQRLFQHIYTFADDVMEQVQAQELLTQIFRGNYKLVCRLPRTQLNTNRPSLGITSRCNLVQLIFHQAIRLPKSYSYWQSMVKVFDLFKALLLVQNQSIDVNQQLIAGELFSKTNPIFQQLLFPLKVIDQRIRFLHPQQQILIEVQRVKEKQLQLLLQKIIQLLALLCRNRNCLAKTFIHEYLNSHNRDGLSVLISYMTIQLPANISSHLCSLLTHLYTDSSPRIPCIKPLLIIDFFFRPAPRQSAPQNSLQDNLLNKHTELISQELALDNILKKKTDQPTLSPQELIHYKEEIYQRIIRDKWSSELLQSISTLIRLQCYEHHQIGEINQLLKTKFASHHQIRSSLKKQNNTNHKIYQNNLNLFPISFAMDIFRQIRLHCVQLQLQKMTCFLKHKYKQHPSALTDQQILFALPISPNIPHFQSYNNINRKVNELYSSQTDLIDILQAFNKSDNLQQLSALFQAIVAMNLPKKQFLCALKQTTIITADDANTFQILFNMYKSLKECVSRSESWLSTLKQNPLIEQSSQYFIKTLQQITWYLNQNYVINSGEESMLPPLINRQLLIRNIGFQYAILELLDTNYYVLEHLTLKIIKVFQKCFTFLSTFAQDCPQTKKILIQHWSCLSRFVSLPEVGQSTLYREIFSGINIKQTKPQIIQNVVLKITQGDYNPIYPHLLYSLIQVQGKVFRPNADALIHALQKHDTLRLFLFQQQIGTEFQLHKVSVPHDYPIQPMRVPYLYHSSALLVLNTLLSSQSNINFLRSHLFHLLSLPYVLSLLSLPDIYLATGIQPALNFVIKQQLLHFICYSLEKTKVAHDFHTNPQLLVLFQYYQTIFVRQKAKTKMQSDKDSLYLPFLKHEDQKLLACERNQREHYVTDVKPLLDRILLIFQKAPNKESLPAYTLLLYLFANIRLDHLTMDFLFKPTVFGINQVMLKWRNFVDADQNNSPQEKYAKKTVLQILRSKNTEQAVRKESRDFYDLIKKREEGFLNATVKLVHLATQAYISTGEDQHVKTILNTLTTLRNYLDAQKEGEQQKEHNAVAEAGLIQILLQYIGSSGFNYNNQTMRDTFCQILRLFNYLLQTDREGQTGKRFFSVLQDPSAFRFFACLQEGIFEIMHRVPGEAAHQQITLALSDMRLCYEPLLLNIDEVALTFISNLCRHLPFTTLLRNQNSLKSIDFLENIFNILSSVLKKGITVTIVDIVEKTVTCLMRLLLGCNKINQNYLIDNKLPQMVREVLKVDKVRETGNRSERAKRNRLLEEVVAFYQGNGLSVRDMLQKTIRRIDFNHIYLLNRLKYTLLQLLLECTVANQWALSKIRLQISVEYLKINMVWVYEEYILDKYQFTKQVLLRKRDDWQTIVETPEVDSLFLIIGFYFYTLIELCNEPQALIEDDNAPADQNKFKEKIIRKFFHSIQEKNKKKHTNVFENQPFAAEMKQYFEKYYEAYEFFKEHTLTIQANIYGHYCRIYFPKIPLCDKVEDDMKEKFISEANRISQDEKLKSLFQYQERLYQQLHGAEEYYERMSEQQPILRRLVQLIKNQQILFLLNWILAFFFTLSYLLVDYVSPNLQFSKTQFSYFSPSQFLTALLFVFMILDAFSGFILLMDLVIRKFPLSYRLQQLRYQQLKEEQGKPKGSMWVFLLTNILSQVPYYIYAITFSFLGLIHPLFSGFQLVYIFFKISIGRQILRSIKETWIPLLAATALLLIINFVFAVIIYNMFTYQHLYGPICLQLNRCLLFLIDQSLKWAGGFLTLIQPIYNYVTITICLLLQFIYIIFAQKVINEIFSGTIIDKFSELREAGQAQKEDQESKCFICGQERFGIDFQLQGFETHTKQTHCVMHYMFYMFYVRTRAECDHGSQQTFVRGCMARAARDWIPDQTSLRRLKLEEEETKEKEDQPSTKFKEFISKKSTELKKIHLKIDSLVTTLKDQIQ